MWEHFEAKLDYMIRRATFAGWEIAPRYIHNYELVFVINGYGNIKIEGKDYPVSTGDLICFRPGVKHSLNLTKEPYMEFYGMHFDISHEIRPFPNVTKLESSLRLETMFKSLLDVHRQKGYLYEWKRNLWLQQILCEVFTILQEKDQPISVMRIRKILDYIHEDPCRRITLDDLLKQAGIQKTLFLQSFRNVTGTTPNQYITAQRLEYARDLLADTNLSIIQIAENCGFNDAFYFSRCFKKHFGVSPRQYRESSLPI